MSAADELVKEFNAKVSVYRGRHGRHGELREAIFAVVKFPAVWGKRYRYFAGEPIELLEMDGHSEAMLQKILDYARENRDLMVMDGEAA